MTKRVLIDARMVGPRLHGVARYVSLLARGLSELNPTAYEPVFLVQKDFRIDGVECIESQSRYLSPFELLQLPREIRKIGPDLYHSPSLSSLTSCPCPWIMTLHDLCHLEYGTRLDAIYYQMILRPFARRARKVLTVSEFSRQAIARWLPAPVNSIEIVYNALDPSFLNSPKEELSQRFGLQAGKYFLCLSNPKPHKNTATLISAYQKANSAWPLVMTMDGQDHAGIRYLQNLMSQEVVDLVSHAGALFFPSFYEGFGLPPAEAAMAGVPIALSSIPAHREALLQNRNACWIEPGDINRWTRALQLAEKGEIPVFSPNERQNLSETYSISRLATHMDQIYQTVLG